LEIKKIVFLSGANITSGGPLQIYRDFLNFLSARSDIEVVAIVSDISLFESYENVNYIEIRNYKKFIFLKFYYEYFRYFSMSKKYNIDLWVSLNDCTPSVKSKCRAVYCHNATPFYRRRFSDLLRLDRVFLQSLYYPVFYRINIRKNNYVIVQQSWFKKYFVESYKVDAEKVIINPVNVDSFVGFKSEPKNKSSNYCFIYPTKAIRYKNIEIICKAVEMMEIEGLKDFTVIITINGNENKFSSQLKKKYRHLNSISWKGSVTRDELEDLYSNSDCLIFPSELETWGLPISEFKKFGKAMLLARLPYAIETVGFYEKVKFFNVSDANELRKYMQGLLKKEDSFVFDKTEELALASPKIYGWNKLLNLLINQNSKYIF